MKLLSLTVLSWAFENLGRRGAGGGQPRAFNRSGV